jgi:hypothetical protein
MVNAVRFSILQYLPYAMRVFPFIHVWKYCHTWHLASLKNNREVMVSTVGVKQSLASSMLTFPFLCPTNEIL